MTQRPGGRIEWSGSGRLVAALSVAAVLSLGAAPLAAQTVREDYWITNGTVNTQLLLDGKLYLGGSFSSVGPVTGSGVPVDSTTGLAQPGFPRVDGQVFVAIPDGAGGWYIGGSFTSVDGQARSNVARVLADNSIASWNPDVNGMVRALVLNGGSIYLGGAFTTVGGITRNRIAEVDTATGTPTSWNPNANNVVRAIVKQGGDVLVAGLFTTVGGQGRNRIAALSAATGLASSWNPNANSSVFALDVSGNTLYAAGAFTNIAGVTRNRLAAIDLTSGMASGWNPNANNQVLALVLGSGTVYVGGQFTTVGGQTRNRIAALDASTGLATSWIPNANNTVNVLALGAGTLFVGGDFLSIGGQLRSRVAGLSVTTGLATAWNPTAFGSVSALGVGGSEIFVGGLFNAVGGVKRNNLAALDATTGVATAWDPNANNQVLALATRGGMIYAGGMFTQMGDEVRNNIAALDTTTGVTSGWDPNADGQVSALAVEESTVFVGGTFTSIGGAVRLNLAAVDAGTGLATSWNPDADDQVLVIEPGDGVVYVGGNFLNVGGQPRNFVASLDAVTGAVSPWDPDANGTVRAISLACNKVYVGGFFSTIGGQARNRIAALDPTTALATSWNPNANGPVFCATPSNGVVYVGGVLSMVGGLNRNRLAAVDAVTGLVTPWNPNSNGTVRAITATGGWVLTGGAFTTMGVTASGNIAAIEADNSGGCPTISLPAPPLATGVAGTPFSQSVAASGGAAPYCYAVSAGILPAGLALSPSTGQITGTPAAAGVSVVGVTATDSRGCTGTQSYSLTIFSAPSASTVAANGSGLCISAAQPCLGVPVVFTRGDSVPVRAMSVTFQLDAAKLSLCTPGAPAASIHAGTWLGSLTNSVLEVTDNGGGSYTVDQVLLGQPCGIVNGGQLFVMDLKAVGPDGSGAITVTSVEARDCANAPIAVSAGAPSTVNLLGTPIVVLPSTLPGAVAGAVYSQTLGASAGTAPFVFTISAGALPSGLSLAAGGGLSGTPVVSGSFAFTVKATDAGGCFGTRAYNLSVTCPVFAATPSTLPDGAVGIAYSQTLTTTGGIAPLSYAVIAGTLPPGLTLSAAGVLSGTPTAAVPAVITIRATDVAGCFATEHYEFDIFSAPPVSSVAANTSGLCISTANPFVGVPFVYTRGESVAARGVKVTFQIDPAMLALRTPSDPAASFHLGSWVAGYTNTQLLVTNNGGGSYTADLVLLGVPCGITTGGTLFTADLASVAGDGLGTITVTSVKSRDCDNTPIAVMAGPQAALHVLNTPITILPAVLPNLLAGEAYAETLSTDSGEPPFTFSVTSGALPPGITLSPAGVLSGLSLAPGGYAFTVSVADEGGCPGSRAYSLTVSCPPIAVLPGTLPDGVAGVAYEQALSSEGGTAPFTWTVSAGSLPAGLSLDPGTGSIAGTPSAADVGVFTISATDTAGCSGSESYTLAIFSAPPVSTIAASTAGLCLSAAHACVAVPIVFDRVETDPARGVSVTVQLDTTKLSLCTPSDLASNIHLGNWFAGFTNTDVHVTAAGGGRYTVDVALLGTPCGITTGGVLFSLDLHASGADGAGAIAVTAAHLRDCAGLPLPVIPGPTGFISINNAPPASITDLTAAQVQAGNGGGPTIGIQLDWSTGGAGIVRIYRAAFGAYALYDALGPISPPDSAMAPGAPWTLVAVDATPGFVDSSAPRGSWHYIALITNECGIASAPSNRTPGTLNYLLGDVSDGITRGHGNNAVEIEDMSLLGDNYGIGAAAITSRGVEYLDVGPTLGGSLTGRPLPDRTIDFEDLFIFAGNFGASATAPQLAARRAAAVEGSRGPEAFRLEAPALVTGGQVATVTLALTARGRMQAFSARIAWNPSVVAPVETHSGGFIENQGGVVLAPSPGTVDAALLGLRAQGVEGDGQVATITFRALRTGDPGIRIDRILARDAANRPVPVGEVAEAIHPESPLQTMLLSPSPNPLRGEAALTYALAVSGPVELAIYGVDGRLVRTLVRESREAGVHHATWDGRDEARRAVAPGVYYARLSVGSARFTRTMVYLR